MSTPPSKSRVAAKLAALDTIVRQGFVPIFVNDSHDSRHLVEAAVNAGCEAIEYSCRRPDAREMIPWIKREFPQLVVMAATLMDGPGIEEFLHRNRPGFLTVAEAADLGADALVSFMRFRPETYERFGRDHVMIAGVSTPNEALDQIELGADLIKATVHTTTGSEFVTKTSVPTHHCIPFFVSGGLTLSNIEKYIEAGVVVTAAGFDMLLGNPVPAPGELIRVASDALKRMTSVVQAAREKYQPTLATAIHERRTNLLASGPWCHRATEN